MPKRRYSARQKLGVVLLELPRYLWALRPVPIARQGPGSWVNVRNRRERLVKSDRGQGVACAWQWTSQLHAPLVFPALGRRLLHASLRDYPICIEDPQAPPGPSERPDVTFIIGHRGRDRLPHLRLTLQSISRQTGVAVECIVVDQDRDSTAAPHLPKWVRYIQTPPPYAAMPYCRSWALNVGARLARAPLLVLHDNDMLVPDTYAAEVVLRHRDGHEIINVKRFVFYLSAVDTRALFRGHTSLAGCAPEYVVQNLEAGGSVAVDRDAYFALGGMDEAFVGWGGEDNEFWQRGSTRRVWPFGYLPVIHTWHPPQPGKRALNGRGSATADLSDRRAIMPVERRIARLRGCDFGNPRALSVEVAAQGKVRGESARSE